MSVDFTVHASLADAQSVYQREIDDKAVAVKGRFATAIDLQGGVYRAKADEADAYKAASSPTSTDYPYLYQESQRTGQTMTEVADAVIANRDAWRKKAEATDPRIEAERVGGKRDVRAATTVRGAYDAKEAVLAALEEIRP